MAASIPVIVICGVGLGVLLMGIFVLEAFVGQVYEGVGKQVVVSHTPRFSQIDLVEWTTSMRRLTM